MAQNKIPEGHKMKVYQFQDGTFSFFTAEYGSWARDQRIVFRVRTDREPKERAAEKERHPRGVSDDPRPRMEKACERLSEPPEPERARAF